MRRVVVAWFQTRFKNYAKPRRTASGLKSNRLVSICAGCAQWRPEYAGHTVAGVYLQLNDFAHDLFANMAIQFMFGYLFHQAFEQLGQLVGQGHALGKQVAAAPKIHQKSHIAVGAFFTTGHGAEHAMRRAPHWRLSRCMASRFGCNSSSSTKITPMIFFSLVRAN